jgi:hypothetical protein
MGTWSTSCSDAAELGDAADNLVPLVEGGVTLTKLRDAMHDTCNCANLVAKKVRGLRDDIGKAMYGVEEWAVMQQIGCGWQDYLCGNHSRNLHFDAFNRAFTSYIKLLLCEGMAEAKLRSGGRLRVEADGEAFVRSICKLTHVGAKQYEKGNPPPLRMHTSNATLSVTHVLLCVRRRDTISRLLSGTLPTIC